MSQQLKQLYTHFTRPARYPSTPILVMSLVMAALGVLGLVVNFAAGHWFIGLMFVAILVIYVRLTIAYWPGRQ